MFVHRSSYLVPYANAIDVSKLFNASFNSRLASLISNNTCCHSYHQMARFIATIASSVKSELLKSCACMYVYMCVCVLRVWVCTCVVRIPYAQTPTPRYLTSLLFVFWVSARVCELVSIFACVSAFVFVRMCVCARAGVNVYVRMRTCVRMHACVCMYVSICVPVSINAIYFTYPLI